MRGGVKRLAVTIYAKFITFKTFHRFGSKIKVLMSPCSTVLSVPQASSRGFQFLTIWNQVDIPESL